MKVIKNVIPLRWRFFLYVVFCLGFEGNSADLRWIHLQVTPNFNQKSITAECIQDWEIYPNDSNIRLLLSPNLTVDAITLNGFSVFWKHNKDSLLITLPTFKPIVRLVIKYHGKPIEADNPPWNGGFIWKISANRKKWLTVTCQDKGGKIWWPSPQTYDERPDSALVTCTYPSGLFFKGNGRLVSDKKLSRGLRKTTWRTSYPINTYNITLNIGDYVHFSDTLYRTDGTKLALDYYPLRKNLDVAKKQFQQAKPMLDCFEASFGPFPYEKDGYSVVEVPYAGMEHQGAIGYGNLYKNGYFAKDYSTIKLEFDFVLIHESAHQWWGNSVTAKKSRDTWHHEALCTFAEYHYVRCIYGQKVAREYINGKKRLVENKESILSRDDIGIDMYAKGSLMWFTLEQLLGTETMNDLLFRFAGEHKYTSISTEGIMNWFSKETGRNLNGFFRQYLEKREIPQLETRLEKKEGNSSTFIFHYRVKNALAGFQLPVELKNGRALLAKLIATGQWQEFETLTPDVTPDSNGSYFEHIAEN